MLAQYYPVGAFLRIQEISMAVPDDAITLLHNYCGLSLDDCRRALETNGPDVDTALAALIDAGKVKPDQLNPDTASDEAYERAARHQKLEMYRKMIQPTSG